MAQSPSANRSRPPLFTPDLPLDSNGRLKIKRLVIANRGEIACRVIATCRVLDIVSIALYTDPDYDAPHVKQADESVSLGPISGPGGNPLLDIGLLVKVALDCKADALHPGYGYLSENGEFSRQVSAAGIIFIGPSPEGMSVLGDKRLAKQYIHERAPDVALVPGYAGYEQDSERLSVEAERIGYPILIKASSGGGGRGMRIVHDSSKLGEELQRAKSEAKRSFGSSDCILEKYVERSKHIEIQIIGDSHGHMISLFERECSIQRRHQKVIEESPSPWLSNTKREAMSDAAISIGKLIDYEGAGTVEFIIDVDTGAFYFLEVNTRIQVEHPITEEVTGLDIVALQLFAAAGGDFTSLPQLQHITQTGHAIECRLCAEDPARDFMPALGRVQRWSAATATLPLSQTTDVRFETGVATGSEVSLHFDSMIAKIVVWAPTRTAAIAKMLKMLAYTVCVGLQTNQQFLQSCLMHVGFLDPAYSTNFIPDHIKKLLKNPHNDDVDALQRLLASVPSLIYRHRSLRAPTGRRPAFRTLPQSFRNQTEDQSNVQCDAVRLHPGSTVLVTWSDEDSASTHATVRSLSDPESTTQPPDGQSKPSTQLVRLYNATVGKSARQPLETESDTTYAVRLRSHSSKMFRASRGPETWHLHDISVTIGKTTHQVYVATDYCDAGSDAGAHRTVFCHLPSVGAPFEYHVYSMLAYGESLRASQRVSTGAAERSMRSPMPCKVLNIRAKEGQTVAKGDVIMIVESMKVEMKTLAPIDGTFRGAVKEGDAVDDGTLLFTIE